jgi:hypothetical protein
VLNFRLSEAGWVATHLTKPPLKVVGSYVIGKKPDGRVLLQTPGRFFDRHAALLESLLQKAAKFGMVLKKSVDQVIVLFERDELKGGDAIDRHDHWFVMAKMSIST